MTTTYRPELEPIDQLTLIGQTTIADAIAQAETAETYRAKITRAEPTTRLAAALACPWCRDPNAGDDVDPADLCRGHLAEHAGLSVAELDRSEREAHLDTL